MAFNSSKRAAAAAVSVACVAPFSGPLTAASEASLTATFTGYSAGFFEDCGYNSALGWNSSSAVELASVSAYQHAFSEVAGAQFQAWCLEIYQGLNLGVTYNFNIVNADDAPGGAVSPGPMGAIKAAVVRDLFSRWISSSTGFVNGGLEDRDPKSAAFQVALWEITHENFSATSASELVGQMSLSTGAFRANLSGATSGWYQQIVQSLGYGGFQSVAIEGMTNAMAQDQIRLAGAVPAPGALALLGLAGLGLRMRRRR